MARPLRVLIVEDSPDDVELMCLALDRGGFAASCRCVETAAAMSAALAAEPWDVILSDHTLPEFDAVAALALLRETGLDVPFLVVSGTIGEERAVEMMRLGASDYILKGNLTRLAVAVERELREAENRRARREAERVARGQAETTARDALLLANVRDSIIVTDLEGTVTYWNDGATRLFGWTAQEMLGRPLFLRVPAADRDVMCAVFRSILAGEAFAGEWRDVRKDGSRVWVHAQVSRIYDSNGRPIGVLGRALDINDRKAAELALRRTEEQLRQAQKMEAVGRLAGGVAHDFNNLLSVILSYASFVADALAPDDPARADIEEVRRAGERAAELTGQLLAFSRQQVIQARVLNLNEVLAGTEKMLRRTLGEDVELSLLPGPGLGRVLADPGQIEQVIMNLVVNARDAMPTGGRLTIETANVTLDGANAREPPGEPPGSYVMLSVSDTGVGMDEATRARIFEPFFTTKEKGKGTGLGLPTVLAIVEQSDGHIRVQSEPGRGTTFQVYLPRTAQTAPVVASAPPFQLTLDGTETVLLVEDEEQVRGLVRAILRRGGYTVIEAQNGGEALLACEQHGGPVHLLLTDVVMPRMSGRQLAERLAPLRPEMRVLFMSGYTDDAVDRHGVVDTGDAYLQKPIRPEALLRKVREVLDA